MKVFPRFLAIGTVLALALAFSPEVNANPPVGGEHDHFTGGPPGEVRGCNVSPDHNVPGECDEE